LTAKSAHSSHGIGRPWLALCFALAVHVAEEAFIGFLPFYGDATRAVSELLPFVTSPSLVLAASMWISVAFVAILTALAPFAYRGAGWMRVATISVALIALANVSGHIVGSMLAGQALPGVYTTPLLAVVGVYALVYAWRWKPGGVEACAA
jgi:small-conductance mechanosensitive channel